MSVRYLSTADAPKANRFPTRRPRFVGGFPVHRGQIALDPKTGAGRRGHHRAGRAGDEDLRPCSRTAGCSWAEVAKTRSFSWTWPISPR